MPEYGPANRYKKGLLDAGYEDVWDANYLHNYEPETRTALGRSVGNDQPPTKPTVTGPEGPEDGGNGGGGGGAHPSFGVKYNIPNAPAFNAPKFDYQGRPIPEFNPQTKFSAPDPSAVNLDPSYQWRLGQGQKALEQSAAGRGTLRSGGTLKNLLSYGQDMASQEYGNIYGRARDTYDANYGQEKDLYAARLGEYGLDFGGYETQFDRNYTGARDEYAPQFATWNARTQAEMRAKDLELANMWAHWYDQNSNPSELAAMYPEKG